MNAPAPGVLARVLSSRKVQIAIATIVVSILVQLGFEQAAADAITDAAIVVAVAVIAGIAAEDASAKFKAGPAAVNEAQAPERPEVIAYMAKRLREAGHDPLAMTDAQIAARFRAMETRRRVEPESPTSAPPTHSSEALRLLPLAGILTLLCLGAAGCATAGRTPDARWAEKRAALTSANNVFSELAEGRVLSDEQTVEFGTGLQAVGLWLDAARRELPAGGSEFDRLLNAADAALATVQERLNQAKAKEARDELGRGGSGAGDGRHSGGPRGDQDDRAADAAEAPGRGDHGRAARARRSRSGPVRRAA